MNARVAAVWLLLTAAAAGALLELLPTAATDLQSAVFEQLLVGVCELALVVCAVWAWAATTAVLAGARRGVPDGFRRLVLVACGLAVASSLALPAGADTGADRGQHGMVAGLPLPVRPLGALALVDKALTEEAPSAEQPPARTVVVRAGDTLWDLAQRHLGDPDAWPRLYATNRAVVGFDPGLIHPGQQLRLPGHPEALADIQEEPS